MKARRRLPCIRAADFSAAGKIYFGAAAIFGQSSICTRATSL